MLQFVASDTYFVTPDLQSSSRNTSQDRMQTDLRVRLPASTQWELMAQAGHALEPVHEALITLAAQGKLIHNDDTTMRVQSLATKVHRLYRDQ